MARVERLKVVVSKRAKVDIANQNAWYLKNRGEDFARTFERNIMNTVNALATTPTIGRRMGTVRGMEARSFPTHPRCVIEYAYNSRTLYILRLRFTALQA